MIKLSILDDDPKDRFITEKAISMIGTRLDISHACSPKEFLEQHWDNVPDILIMDVNLGSENGHAFATQLKALPQFQLTRIKMISGFITSASKQYRCAHSLGHVIIKPMRRKDFAPFAKAVFDLNSTGLRQTPLYFAA